MAVPATKTGVQALLGAHGFHPKRLRGQHFLVDRNLIDAIVRDAGVGPADCVLEIGTGTGILTDALAGRAGRVVSCDLDVRLQGIARGLREWPPSVVFLVEDVLKRANLTETRRLAEVSGAQLEGLQLLHPFYDRTVPTILGEHVTLDAGTGAVHTAPGHGQEDFEIGQKYKLPVYNYDVNMAKQLLDQAGWVPGPDGIRAKGGEKEAKQRLAAISQSTRIAKDVGESSPMVDALKLAGAFSPVVARSIASFWSRNQLSRHVPMNISTVISNVVGPDFPLYCAGARMVNRTPASASTSSVSVSTAVSGSHIPSASRANRARKSASPQATWVTLSRREASGMIMWL